MQIGDQLRITEMNGASHLALVVDACPGVLVMDVHPHHEHEVFLEINPSFAITNGAGETGVFKGPAQFGIVHIKPWSDDEVLEVAKSIERKDGT